MIDLETRWRQGQIIALRRMPREWTLTDPDQNWQTFRELVWLGIKTVAGVALVVILYAAAS